MEQKKEIADILRRVRELWIVQSRLNERSPQQDAVLWEIRALSDEYQTLIERDKKKPK